MLDGSSWDDLEGIFGFSETHIRKKLGSSILRLISRMPQKLLQSSLYLRNIQRDIDVTHESTIGLTDSVYVLYAQYLYDLITSGYTANEALEWLESHNIRYIHKKYTQENLRRGLNLICNKIWSANYDDCRMELFIKPLIDEFKVESKYFLIGEGSEKIEPQEIFNLLKRRFDEKFKIGEGSQELDIIERLAIRGLNYAEMAKVLELEKYAIPTGQTDKITAPSNAVSYYVKHRWGYTNIDDFRQFLKTHFLGRQ